MYELNKIAFGSFLAQLRREKGMTQKELAACLYVSDKAVSKCPRIVTRTNIFIILQLFYVYCNFIKERTAVSSNCCPCGLL